MGKAIKFVKTTSFIIILIQLLLAAAFTGLYFTNLFNFKELAQPTFIAVGASIVVFIDCIFVWVFSLIISSLRHKTDLHAAEIIGSDVQEAYNFAQIGLAITDEENIVIWTNDLFKNRHMNIIDSNILEWRPELSSLKDTLNSHNTVKIDFNGKSYEVKLLMDAGLWIFKDVTDYEYIFNYSKQQAPVVGILAIDNYDDVVRGEDDFNDIVTKVKNVIFDYTKEYGILIRKIKDDSYSMLCNFESFTRMKEDKFSIVDRVRDVGNGQDIPLTLSIGLAHDFPDVNKLNELAFAALDIAMSRGGDQIVVSAYGQEMEFFGGKSEAQEKRNRVKVRVLADSLISLIKNNSNIMIMGHTNMDMDALGACLGIKAICDRLASDKMRINSHIIVDLKNTEFKTRSALTSSFSKDELDKIVLNSKEAEAKINHDTLLIVVDVHIPNMVMAPKLLDLTSKVVVIDHHRRAEEYIDSPVFNHIDPAASSTCELVTEFIRFSSLNPRIELPSSYATIMMSGIFLDSSYFKSKSTGMRTFEACTILKEYGADNSMADDFLKDDYEEHRVINDIVSNLEHPYYGVVVCKGDQERIYDTATIAKAANACLTFKGVHAVFAFGKTSPREIRMSARSDGTINVQLLAEKLGGGGHFTSAAVSFDKPDFDEVRQALLNVLETSLESARSDKKRSEED